MILRKKLRNYWDKSTAFSIIELAATLALIVLLLAIIIPRQNFFTDVLLKNELEHLFTTFSYLQQKAIASNQPQTLLFNEKNNSYSWPLGARVAVHTLSPQVQFGYVKNTKGPPSSPKKQIIKSITFKENSVIFSPDGKITPGTVYLVDNKKKFFKALTCPIAQVSFIRKYRYVDDKKCNSKKWVPN